MKNNGARIKFAREYRNLSVESTIRKLHKSKATYYRWEAKGIRDVYLLLALAKVFECSFLWLAFNVGVPNFELSQKLTQTINNFWVKEACLMLNSVLNNEKDE